MIIEVSTVKLSPLVSPSLRARRELGTEAVEREVKSSLKPFRFEWPLIVGKFAKVAVLCANHFAVLERETDPDEEEYFPAALDEGFAFAEYCVVATGSTTRVFGAPKTHPAGSPGARGMGDREFGLDEKKSFSAQPDGEPTSEEHRRGDS
eukprot:4544125-Amphidinium_carterae.1